MCETRSNYSLKNIPPSSQHEYKLLVMDKTENLQKKICWKLFFANLAEENKSNFGSFSFRSNNYPPAQYSDFVEFERDIFNIVRNLKFSN